MTDDYCGNARDDGKPDIGAIEYDGCVGGAPIASGGGEGGTTGTDTGSDGQDGASGCGCRSDAPGAAGGLFGLVLLGLRWRR